MFEITTIIKPYSPIPTIRKFHESKAPIRAIVGPVGSAKTSGATMEVCYYLPHFIHKSYGVNKTTWVVVRNTYRELMDTTVKTIKDPDVGWFPNGEYRAGDMEYVIRYENGIEVQLLFRSCDRPQDVKKFKSLEVYGYWIDESIEVPDAIKRMLKNRIGRQPNFQTWAKCLRKTISGFSKYTDEQIRDKIKENPGEYITRAGIETTNPPDVEHTTYSEFNWQSPPPGPIPKGAPKVNHVGFWQPPRENEPNLRPNYYEDLLNDYADNPDWGDMYVEGKPGVLVRGKLVYNNFRREHHVATVSLIWPGGKLYRGWDNSGNCPACVLVQVPTANHIQVLREYTTDKMGIVDFTQWVVGQCNTDFPNAKFLDWGDPAGAAKFSKKDGGFTSNSQLMADVSGVNVVSSDQNFTARTQAVDQALGRIDGLLIDPRCTRLINGFIGGYCYPEIGNTGEYSQNVEKNRFSHPHDALQYVLLKLLKSKSSVTNFTPDRTGTRKANMARASRHFTPRRRAA